MAIKRFPYLAQYNDTSQYENIILYMLEAHRGMVIYIPPDLTNGDPRNEITMMEPMTPASVDLNDYTGSVIIRGDGSPTLED